MVAMTSKAYTFIVLLCFSAALHAQTGSWNVLQLRYNLSSRFTIVGESQLRSLSFYDQFHFYEYKGGLVFKLSPNIQTMAGIGRYTTHPAGGDFVRPIQQIETRTWQDVVMRHSEGRVRFEHRYRGEQRFTNLGYRNRFRYRFHVQVPLNHRELSHRTLFISIWDEVFLTNRVQAFERNRVYGGLGYRWNGSTWQMGFVNQVDFRLFDEIGKNFFFISWVYEWGREPSDVNSAEQVN